MTTAANRFDVARNEEGQSVLEFLLMLPVMVGLVVIMVEVNTAIQMSIVDQQYAREEATFQAYNSPVYPSLSLRANWFDPLGYNQELIGVSDNEATSAGHSEPMASTERITRTARAPAGSNDARAEPPQRSLVRVRNTVTLCTQSEVIGTAGGTTPIYDLSNPQATYNLPDNTPINWEYCRSPIPMQVGGSS